MRPDNLWIYSQANDLYWKGWGNEAVLYDNRSGDTHLISKIGMEMLNYIKDNSIIDQTSLMGYLSDLFDELPVDQQDISLEEHLKVFEDMGFIKRKKS